MLVIQIALGIVIGALLLLILPLPMIAQKVKRALLSKWLWIIVGIYIVLLAINH